MPFDKRLALISYLAEYSPLPHTPLWENALACLAHPLETEPLFQNNSFLPCWGESKRTNVQEVKKMVKEFRRGKVI